ncbi:hypothetical protein COLO4_38008 [Corchorus olitorius]|uniref:Uncharacterized protein n=1 Tax=Corchorus olitorius TaxID=93759 RepID=A0A1R3FXI4_9ROSI|nr:hypothetical protein COLO4_38008 [Corchorus olitorius]
MPFTFLFDIYLKLKHVQWCLNMPEHLVITDIEITPSSLPLSMESNRELVIVPSDPQTALSPEITSASLMHEHLVIIDIEALPLSMESNRKLEIVPSDPQTAPSPEITPAPSMPEYLFITDIEMTLAALPLSMESNKEIIVPAALSVIVNVCKYSYYICHLCNGSMTKDEMKTSFKLLLFGMTARFQVGYASSVTDNNLL